MPSPEDVSTRRAMSRIGSVLRGKWRIDRLVGIGGMAAVYAGTHRNGKRGAIKILHVDLSADPDAKSRFLHEGFVANRLDHPGAVSVLDDDVAEDGAVFLVMELLEGRSVEAVASERPRRRLAPAEALNIVDQLLDVLAVAHEKGIVHRDLKPENLFLTSGGVIKVLDFGIARIRDQGPPDGARGGARAAEHSTHSNRSRSTHATQVGNAMGTPAFMPPEQALGSWDQVDARTDLWAAGATLFTLLTGRQVHEAPTLEQLMLAAMTRPAPPIRQVLPDLPEPVAAVVDRALAFDRERRWQTAREMQRAVREVGRTLPGFTDPPGTAMTARPSEQPVSDPENASLLGTTLFRERYVRPKRPALRIAVGAVTLAGAAFVVLAVMLGGPRSPGAAGAPPSTAGPQRAADAPTAAPEPPAIAPATAAPEPTGAAPTATAATSAPPPRSSTPPPPTTSAKPQKTAPPSAKSTDPFLKWE